MCLHKERKEDEQKDREMTADVSHNFRISTLKIKFALLGFLNPKTLFFSGALVQKTSKKFKSMFFFV